MSFERCIYCLLLLLIATPNMAWSATNATNTNLASGSAPSVNTASSSSSNATSSSTNLYSRYPSVEDEDFSLFPNGAPIQQNTPANSANPTGSSANTPAHPSNNQSNSTANTQAVNQPANTQQTGDSQKTSLLNSSEPINLMGLPTENGQVEPGVLGPVTLRATLHKSEQLPLTLKQALQLANGQDIAISLGDANAILARQSYELSLAALLPSISLSYVQSRFSGTSQSFSSSAPVSYTQTTYQPRATATYPIYLGGSNFFTAKSNEYTYKSQKSAAESTRQITLEQVAVAYYALQEGYWQKAIALEAIRAAQAELDLNQGRFQAGVGVQLDVLQSQTNLATQQQTLITAESTISQNTNLLSQLLNLKFNINIVPTQLDSSITRLIAYDTPTSDLLQIAKTHNPQLIEYQQLVKANKYSVWAAKGNFLPVINLSAYVQKTGAQPNSLYFSQFEGLQANWNVLQNLGVAAIIGLNSAKTNMRMADLSLAQVDRSVEQTLADAIVNLKSLEAQIQVAQVTLKYAKAEYANAFGRLKGGVGTTIDLENALATLTQARFTLTNAFLSYNQTQALLLQILGLASVNTLTDGYQLNPATIPHSP